MEPLKNLFSPALVRSVGENLRRQLPELDTARFEQPIIEDLDRLELKERAQLVADYLHAVLPADQQERRRILLAMLHPGDLGADETSEADGLRGWSVMPLTLVVGQHGLADFDGALHLLKEMTKRLTSEFAIRYCLLHDQPRAFKALAEWVRDPNRHVRRLVSEGTRPRLPWAMRLPALIADPSPSLPLLEALKDDPEDYVRRSVANHLNDISKDHPDLVVDIAARWMIDASEARKSLLRHACRTLIKKGHAGALSLFGRHAPVLAPVELGLSARRVDFPGVVTLEATLISRADALQHLTVDYVVHYCKANGKRAPKVFKGASMSLAPGESRSFRRVHKFADITTRRHYSGKHSVGLRINGQDTKPVEFELVI